MSDHALLAFATLPGAFDFGALATVAALIAILLTGYWLALAYVKARGPDAFRRRGG
jgi:uncharacterized membrane protein YccF (DUF307 family)